jgi:hypothetical protein
MVRAHHPHGGPVLKQSILIASLVLLVLVPGCGREDEYNEPEAFSFVVYPGARYLGGLSDVTRQAHKIAKPNEEPPPVAIYETDASLEEVASFYAKSYGYGEVAPDSTNNLSAAKPPAFYRTGDLATDAKQIAPMIPQLNLKTDITKATGAYRAADIEPRPNRPRVTVQRPYFDVTTSQVVDKTLILMAR